MSYTKEEAIQRVVSCAEIYRDELNKRNLLFVCMDKHKKLSYFEVAFYNYNFMHLTGLRPCNRKSDNSTANTDRLSAVVFYDRCISHKLSPDDFDFSDQGTTPLKLDALPLVIKKNLMATMIGDYNSPRPKLYSEKFAGGVTACIGFIKDKSSKEYVPNTVLKDDIRNNVGNYARIIATYRKHQTEEKYSEIVYAAKKIDWATIIFSDKYSYLPIPG
ncbi:MAG: PBECR4 domain-containing protein [Clostridiales bacterium]|nr:PBECR4 domain-containing protein [Clostridiales bacterium]